MHLIDSRSLPPMQLGNPFNEINQPDNNQNKQGSLQKKHEMLMHFRCFSFSFRRILDFNKLPTLDTDSE